MCERRGGDLPTNPLAHHHAREERDHDTDAEGHGEATDDARADHEEDGARDECRDVAIADARPRFMEACIDRSA